MIIMEEEKCFVISPMRLPDSETRVHADISILLKSSLIISEIPFKIKNCVIV